MCSGGDFEAEARWFPFAEAARSGTKGFEEAPPKQGIYMLRVVEVGEPNLEFVRQRYEETPFYRAIHESDRASESFFSSLGFGDGWGWEVGQIANARLERLSRISMREKRLTCPLIYVGCTNSLRRRVSELVQWGHTANHPFWALAHSGWKFEIGIRATRAKQERLEEARLKKVYADLHEGALPALVQR